MKNITLFILISLVHSSIIAQKTSLNNIRVLYQKSATDKNSCIQLNKEIASVQIYEDAVLYGYKAVSKMMMANYVTNPFTKLSYFKEGKKMLDNVIDNNKTNIELRFLRLCVQENAPAFLGYNDDIDDDKKFIKLYLASLKDFQLKTQIHDYLK